MPFRCFECNPQTGEIRKVCKHLNKFLPRESGQSVNAFLCVDPNKIKGDSVTAQVDPAEQEVVFRHRVLSYGLTEQQANILTLKFVFSWSLRDISEYLFIPAEEVHNSYKQSLDLLRMRGFRAKS